MQTENNTMIKKDLKPINNLKPIIRDIRAYMAGNATGITRDETIVKNLMLIIMSKIYDEISKADDEPLDFYVVKEDDNKMAELRINCLFEKVKQKYSDIFTKKVEESPAPIEESEDYASTKEE